MNHIVYCLFRTGQHLPPAPITGIDGRPVAVITSGDLSAAASPIGAPPSDRSLPQIMAYRRVVDSFHHNLAVVPMRYSSMFADIQAIKEFLANHSSRFCPLLEELDGRVEMGIRVRLLEEKKARKDLAHTADALSLHSSAHPAGSRWGAAYLASRKLFYERQAWEASQKREVIEKCRRPFAHLCANFKSEQDASNLVRNHFPFPLVSLYFLISAVAVHEFRLIFQRTRWESSMQLCLSGPWPPYNFV